MEVNIHSTTWKKKKKSHFQWSFMRFLRLWEMRDFSSNESGDNKKDVKVSYRWQLMDKCSFYRRNDCLADSK